VNLEKNTLAEVSFGAWLKRRRKAAGLTQEQLADQVSCSTITLRKIESEERRPSAQIVERLAEIFNIPQNEQTAFLRFARGDWKAAPTIESEDAPWRAALVSPRSNLPASFTSLIGREQDIAKVREYLSNANIRLATLIGPPGIGKTSLSLEVARKSIHDFTDGVFFVPLAPLDDPNLIAPTIIQALDFVETKRHPAIERLKDGIEDKHMLLVLDNLEHLIEDTAPIVSELLVSCPLLKILTTSREALRVPGEWLYPVPTLTVPPETSSIDLQKASQFSALTLFVERARTVQPDFALNVDNIEAVTKICNQLDGLPLAIELIATRIRLMSPQFLLSHLSGQFVLSADGMRAVSARQKTLQNAIGWSYSLLSEEEQKLFMRLSVFSGGFTLEAAEAIFSRTVTKRSISNLIASLLDKSLLQRVPNDWGGPRFTMLVTIQQFALDRLRRMDDEAEVRQWHIAHFLELAERADREIHGPNQVEWLDRLEAEHDNYRAALDWCVANNMTEFALLLHNTLSWAWLVQAHHAEAYSWFDKIRILPNVPNYQVLYARALNQIGSLGWLLGDYRAARSILEESQQIWLKLGAGGEQGLAEVLNYLGMVVLWGNQDNDTAQSHFEHSFNLYQKLGDQRGMAVTLLNLGKVAGDRNENASALSLFEQSLDRFRQLGDVWGIGRSSMRLGELFLKEGNYEKALFFLKQYLTICEELHFRQGITFALMLLGDLYRYQGDYDRAEQLYEKSLTISRKYSLNEGQANAFFSLGCVALHRTNYLMAARYFKDNYNIIRTIQERGSAIDIIHMFAAVSAGMNQFERAARLYGAAQALMEVSNFPDRSYDHVEANNLIQIARKQLGGEKFETLAAEGRAMTVEQAIQLALS
jgi:predicted ATPase/DNA-binding XRE family transcriptional regulator